MKANRRLFNLVKGEARFDTRVSGAINTDDVAVASMYLYDEISPWGIMAADFVSELVGLGGQDFNLHVNSPGGDVFEGISMLNTIRAYPGRVTVYVDGIAASAASFLIMGADEVVMGRNSELMIHDAWGMCLGNASDMLDMAQRLDKVSDNIADVYASKTPQNAGYWRTQMQAETWYSAEEAVAAGLADRSLRASSSSEALVAYDLSRFKNFRAAPAVAVEDEFEWISTEELRGAFEEATR